MCRSRLAFFTALLSACGEPLPTTDAGSDAGTDAGPPACEVEAFERGDPAGHADPLGVGAGEARAGRVAAEDLPPLPSRLEVWEGGDFVLANEHLAMVIEDAGESDLYDPWGGRPVGIARVENGALVDPGDFGEILILLGRMTVLTQHVSVIADGSDGGAAIVRAEGVMRPLPFFESITGNLLATDFSSVIGAIDYVLEPGARHVDVHLTLRARETGGRALTTMHGFMHTPRMPPFSRGIGFETGGRGAPWIGFADERGMSFAYIAPAQDLGAGLEVSGFVSFFTRATQVRPCTETRIHHARIVIGGPGSDGLTRAVYETVGTPWREITGTVRDASGAAASGVWVLAEDDTGYVSRALSDGDGRYTITAPTNEVRLFTFRRGDRPSEPVSTAADTQSVDLTLSEGGFIVVRATEDGAPVPARVQILPAVGASAPTIDGRFGIPAIPRGRIQVEYPVSGAITLRAPAGDVRVVVSRGYEYEVVEREVNVVEGETVELDVALERVIDTGGVQCGDFHIHTHRSNDSEDDAVLKVRSALADGVELPVRSDHEYPSSFQPILEELGATAFAYGIASLELTSFETWGHMGAVPITPLPDEVNAGAPRWQRYPTIDDPDRPIETLSPVEVFDATRARPEAPLIIINHPRGDADYFTYVGYDPVTGGVSRPDDWDEELLLVEVFNDADWRRNFDTHVRDWLSFLNRGHRVFAVGSSDSHAISGSPVGYPRTCLAVGTDDPSALSPEMVRAALAAGNATISGGVYVDAHVGGQGPGSEVRSVGESAMVHVRVQAASWIDVDRIDVVVDGEVTEQIDIDPIDDPDPTRPTTRFERDILVEVAPSGSYVIVAAYGDATLEPVHPGRVPFGVTNPIFLSR